MSESSHSNVNVETVAIKPVSTFTRFKDRTCSIAKTTGRAVVTGSDQALTAVEAAVLTVAEPVVVVAKEAGGTYGEKFQSIRENSKLRAGRRAIKRAERDNRRVEEAKKILAAAEQLPVEKPAVVTVPAKAPAKAPRTAKATA